MTTRDSSRAATPRLWRYASIAIALCGLALALSSCATVISMAGSDTYAASQVTIDRIAVTGVPGDHELMTVEFEALVETLWACNAVEVQREGRAIKLRFKRQHISEQPGRLESVSFDVTGVDLVRIDDDQASEIWRRPKRE